MTQLTSAPPISIPFSGDGVLFRTGRAEPPAPAVPLRAGPLTLRFDQDSLRDIRYGGREIVRRVYCAVRDRNWQTIENRVHNLRQQVLRDSFTIEFDVDNRQDDIDFHWQARITGTAQGVVTFEFAGEARREFLRNRIGLCVLHPIEGCAGAACKLTAEDGRETTTEFPRYIAPRNPFQDFRTLRHELEPGRWVKLDFAGDLFETEDQRNWTDASFKTFCTPLRLPFPVAVHPGDRIRQRVTISVEGGVETSHQVGNIQVITRVANNGESVTLVPDTDAAPVRLPRIGLGWTPHDEPWTSAEIESLRALSLDHLRIELRLQAVESGRIFEQAAGDAARIGAPLAVALFLSDAAERELMDFVSLLKRSRPPVVRWEIFPRTGWTTPVALLHAARTHLAKYDPAIPVGSGTAGNFAELNFLRPDPQTIDFAVYSMNPQEHACDDASLVETLEAQVDTVASARQFLQDRPIVIAPVTLKKRVNPYGTGQLTETPAGSLPGRVDPRQMSLFGAAWTLGCLKSCAASHVSAVTFYETHGWLGVLERTSGSPLPRQFPSIPGAVFPLYHVLADAGEMADASVVPLRSSAPLQAAGLLLRTANQTRLLVANLSGEPQRIRPATPARRALVRLLDEHNVRDALREPATFRRSGVEQRVNGAFELHLPPYATACVDWQE